MKSPTDSPKVQQQQKSTRGTRETAERPLFAVCELRPGPSASFDLGWEQAPTAHVSMSDPGSAGLP